MIGMANLKTYRLKIKKMYNAYALVNAYKLNQVTHYNSCCDQHSRLFSFKLYPFANSML